MSRNRNDANPLSNLAQPPCVIYQNVSTEYPSPRELRRLRERQHARELGHELSLNTREAAAYVGLHYKTVERMARNGQIPAHPISGVRRKTWRFYASELDVWLHSRLSSVCHPCSPNGKDTVQ